MSRSLAVVLGLSILTSCTTEQSIEVENNTSSDSSTYFKAVCYHPVPAWDTLLSWETLDQDLALMTEAGITTIRVYVPIADKAVLDKIAAADMQVITSFGYNQDSVYDILSGSFIDYVVQFKEHPAIFLWELGNEYNYHPEWFGDDLNNWYDALESAVDAIHAIDTEHLVSTAHGEIPDSLALYKGRNLDMWGFNVYRWDVTGYFFADWAKSSDKPFYFSEVGSDSYMTTATDSFAKGENQKAQAAAVANILDEILAYENQFQGISLFSFTDGWWKAGNPHTQDIGGWATNSSGVPYDGSPNEEYWGIVDINREKKEVFEVVKTRFNNAK